MKRTINLEDWWELSDIMLSRTRELSDENRNHYTTSGWRTMSDHILQELLEKLDIEVER